MKKNKQITRKSAQKQTRGFLAVLAALMLTIITFAAWIKVYVSGNFLDLSVSLFPAFLAINTIIAWMIVFCKGTAGLAAARIMLILQIVAIVPVTALFSIQLVDRFTLGNLTETVANMLHLDTSIIDTFTVPGIIFLVVACILILLYYAAALSTVSAASRAYKGQRILGTGKLFGVMSSALAIIFVVLIPIRIMFDTFASLLKLDTSVISLSSISLDFASYSLEDIAVVAEVIAAPIFFALIGAISKKLSESTTRESVDNVVKADDTSRGVEPETAVSAAVASVALASDVVEVAAEEKNDNSAEIATDSPAIAEEPVAIQTESVISVEQEPSAQQAEDDAARVVPLVLVESEIIDDQEVIDNQNDIDSVAVPEADVDEAEQEPIEESADGVLLYVSESTEVEQTAAESENDNVPKADDVACVSECAEQGDAPDEEQVIAFEEQASATEDAPEAIVSDVSDTSKAVDYVSAAEEPISEKRQEEFAIPAAVLTTGITAAVSNSSENMSITSQISTEKFSQDKISVSYFAGTHLLDFGYSEDTII